MKKNYENSEDTACVFTETDNMHNVQLTITNNSGYEVYNGYHTNK